MAKTVSSLATSDGRHREALSMLLRLCFTSLKHGLSDWVVVDDDDSAR